jgi:hypothetical protein
VPDVAARQERARKPLNQLNFFNSPFMLPCKNYLHRTFLLGANNLAAYKA